jgi:hypothetical protein
MNIDKVNVNNKLKDSLTRVMININTKEKELLLTSSQLERECQEIYNEMKSIFDFSAKIINKLTMK